MTLLSVLNPNSSLPNYISNRSAINVSSGYSASLTIAIPSNIAPGSLLIAIVTDAQNVGVQPYNYNVAAQYGGGWTEVQRYTSPTEGVVSVWYKYSDGDEDNATFTFINTDINSNIETFNLSGTILNYSGTAMSNPIDSVAFNSSGGTASTALVAPSVSSAAPGAYISAWSAFSGQFATVPGSVQTRVALNNGTSTSIQAVDQTHTAAGSSGTVTLTAGLATKYLSVSIALAAYQGAKVFAENFDQPDSTWWNQWWATPGATGGTKFTWDFETANYFGPGAYWSAAINTTTKHSGTKSLLTTRTNASSGNGYITSGLSSALTAGNLFAVSGWFFASDSSQYTIAVQPKTSGNVAVGPKYYQAFTPTPNEWFKATIYFLAPATSVNLDVYITDDTNLAPIVGSTLIVDDVVLYQVTLTPDVLYSQGRIVSPATASGASRMDLINGPVFADTDITASIIPATANQQQWAVVAMNGDGVGTGWYSGTGYALYIGYTVGGGNTLSLILHGMINGTDTEITAATPVTITGLASPNEIRVRFQRVGTALRARVWPATGTEPGTWQITGTATGTLATGVPSITSVASNAGTAQTIYLDNILVTDPVYAKVSTVTGTIPASAGLTGSAVKIGTTTGTLGVDAQLVGTASKAADAVGLIPNISARWRGDSITGVSNGVGIQTWPDMSGNNFSATQSDPLYRPTYVASSVMNSQPAVSFNGPSSQSFSTSSPSGSPQQTLVAVLRANTPASGASGTIRGSSAAGGLQFRIEGSGSGAGGPSSLGLVKQSITNIGYSTVSFQHNTPMIVVGTYDATTGAYTFRINGNSAGSGTNNVGGLSAFFGTIGFNAINGEYLTGEIAELVTYDRVLTGTELTTIETYAAARYAISDVRTVTGSTAANAQLTGSAFSVKTATGSLPTNAQTIGSAVGVSTQTGQLSTNAQITGTSTRVAIATGTTPANAGLSGSAVKVGISTGTLGVAVGLVGSATTGDAPGSISNLASRYRADSITGVSSGSVITSWSDMTTNGYTATPYTATAPTFITNSINGQPVVRFSNAGTGTALLSSAPNGTGATTIVAVVNITAAGTQTLRGTTGNNGSQLRLGGFPFVPQINYQGYGTYANGAYNGPGSPYMPNGTYVITAAYDPINGPWSFSINGRASGSGSGTYGFTAYSQTLIGAGGAGEFFFGDMAEFIAYDRALTSTEIASIESYAADRYGITLLGALATTTGTLPVSAGLTGTSTRVALATGALGANAALTGTSTRVALASGSTPTNTQISGAAYSVKTATGTLSTSVALTGTPTFIATATGTLGINVGLTGLTTVGITLPYTEPFNAPDAYPWPNPWSVGSLYPSSGTQTKWNGIEHLSISTEYSTTTAETRTNFIVNPRAFISDAYTFEVDSDGIPVVHITGVSRGRITGGFDTDGTPLLVDAQNMGGATIAYDPDGTPFINVPSIFWNTQTPVGNTLGYDANHIPAGSASTAYRITIGDSGGADTHLRVRPSTWYDSDIAGRFTDLTPGQLIKFSMDVYAPEAGQTIAWEVGFTSIDSNDNWNQSAPQTLNIGWNTVTGYLRVPKNSNGSIQLAQLLSSTSPTTGLNWYFTKAMMEVEPFKTNVARASDLSANATWLTGGCAITMNQPDPWGGNRAGLVQFPAVQSYAIPMASSYTTSIPGMVANHEYAVAVWVKSADATTFQTFASIEDFNDTGSYFSDSYNGYEQWTVTPTWRRLVRRIQTGPAPNFYFLWYNLAGLSDNKSLYTVLEGIYDVTGDSTPRTYFDGTTGQIPTATVQNGQGLINTGSAEWGQAGVTLAAMPAIADMEVTGTIVTPPALGTYVVAVRVTGENIDHSNSYIPYTGYTLNLYFGASNNLYGTAISRWENTVGTDLVPYTNVTQIVDQVSYRVKVVGQRLQVRFWPKSIDEPNTWNYDFVDPGTALPNGRVRLSQLGTSPGNRATSYTDDILVSGASIIEQAVLTGTLPINAALSGAAYAVKTATGSLPTNTQLAGTAFKVALTTGSTPVNAQMSGAALGVSTQNVSLPVAVALTNAAIGVSIQAGSTPVTVALVGTASGISTQTGTLAANAALSNTAVGVKPVTGSLPMNAQVTGAAVTYSTTHTGTLPVAVALNDVAMGVFTTTGTLPANAQLASSSIGVGIFTGQLAVNSALTGASVPVRTYTQALGVNAALSGVPISVKPATGSTPTNVALTGTHVPVSTQTGSLPVSVSMTGSASSVGIATGQESVTVGLTGTPFKVGISSGAEVANVALTGTGTSSVIVPYTETFTGSDGSSWPSVWTKQSSSNTAFIQNNMGRMNVLGGYYSPVAEHLTGIAPLGDSEISGTVVFPVTSVEQYVYIGLNGDGPTGNSGSWVPNNGYFLDFYVADPVAYPGDYDGIFIFDSVNQDQTNLVWTPFPLVAGHTYGYRFQRIGQVLRARVWDTTDAEPPTWNLQATIAGTPFLGWPWVTFANGADQVPRYADLDNISISVPQPAVVLTGTLPVNVQMVGTATPGPVALPYTETFTGINGSAWPSVWTKRGNGVIDIQNNAGRIVSPAGSNESNRADLNMSAIGNTEITGTLVGTATNVNQYVAINLNGNPNGTDSVYGPYASNEGVGLWLNYFDYGYFGLQLWYENASGEYGSPWAEIDTPNFAGTTKAGFRVQSLGNVVRARVWDASTPEPTRWHIVWTVPETMPTGIVSLATYSDTDGVPREFIFDDVKIFAAVQVEETIGILPVTTQMIGTPVNVAVQSTQLPVTVNLSSTYSRVGIETGALGVNAALAGTASRVTFATGTLSANAALSGTAVGISTQTGSTPINVALSSTAVGVSAKTGSVPVSLQTIGTASGISTQTGSTPVSVGTAGAAVSIKATTGSLSVNTQIAGSAYIYQTSQTGTLPIAVALNDVAMGVFTTTGTLPVAVALNGAHVPVGISSGTLGVNTALTGAMKPVGVDTGILGINTALIGVSSPVSTYTGIVGVDAGLSGASISVKAATGALGVNAALNGIPAPITTVAGSTPANVILNGASVPVAIYTGTLFINSGLTGTSVGVYPVSGALSINAGISGVAQKFQTTHTGTLPANADMTGTAFKVLLATGSTPISVAMNGATSGIATTASSLPITVGITGSSIGIGLNLEPLGINVGMFGVPAPVTTVTGVLGINTGLAGAARSTVIDSRALPANVGLSSVVAPITATTGTLPVAVALTLTDTGIATATGVLGIATGLTGASTGVKALSGQTSINAQITGAASSVRIITGTAPINTALQGSAISAKATTGTAEIDVDAVGSIVPIATTTAQQSVAVSLASSVTPVNIGTGILSTNVAVQSVFVPVGVNTGALPITVGITPSAVGSVTATGNLSANVAMTGAMVPLYTTTQSLPVTVNTNGSAYKVMTTTGALPITAITTGMIVPVGIDTGTLPVAVPLNGASIPSITTQSVLGISAGLSATSYGASGVLGDFPIQISLNNQSTGIATLTGKLDVAVSTYGTASRVDIRTGTLPISVPLTGSAVGVQTYTQSLPVTVGLSGAIRPVVVETGTLPISVDLSVTGTGTALVTGTLPVQSSTIGSATKIGTSTGTLNIATSLSGTASKVGIVSGALNITTGLVGIASPVRATTSTLPISTSIAGSALSYAEVDGSVPVNVDLDSTLIAGSSISGRLAVGVSIIGQAVKSVVVVAGTLAVRAALAGSAARTTISTGTLPVVASTSSTSSKTTNASGELPIDVGLDSALTIPDILLTRGTLPVRATVNATAASVKIAEGRVPVNVGLLGRAGSSIDVTGSLPINVGTDIASMRVGYGLISVYVDGEWVRKPVMAWDGEKWVQRPLTYWDGERWSLV